MMSTLSNPDPFLLLPGVREGGLAAVCCVPCRRGPAFLTMYSCKNSLPPHSVTKWDRQTFFCSTATSADPYTHCLIHCSASIDLTPHHMLTWQCNFKYRFVKQTHHYKYTYVLKTNGVQVSKRIDDCWEWICNRVTMSRSTSAIDKRKFNCTACSIHDEHDVELWCLYVGSWSNLFIKTNKAYFRLHLRRHQHKTSRESLCPTFPCLKRCGTEHNALNEGVWVETWVGCVRHPTRWAAHNLLWVVKSFR